MDLWQNAVLSTLLLGVGFRLATCRIYINCGGEAYNYTDRDNYFRAWQADGYFNDSGPQITKFLFNTAKVEKLDDSFIFPFDNNTLRSVRVFGSQTPSENKYMIQVENKAEYYWVRLLFAELLYANGSARRFGLEIQEFVALREFSATNLSRAYNFEYLVPLQGDTLNISLTRGSIGDPMISGIAVMPAPKLHVYPPSNKLLGTVKRFSFSQQNYDDEERTWRNMPIKELSAFPSVDLSTNFSSTYDFPPFVFGSGKMISNSMNESIQVPITNLGKNTEYYFRLSLIAAIDKLRLDIRFNNMTPDVKYEGIKVDSRSYLWVFHFTANSGAFINSSIKITPGNVDSKYAVLTTTECFRTFDPVNKTNFTLPQNNSQINRKALLWKGAGIGAAMAIAFILFCLPLVVNLRLYAMRSVQKNSGLSSKSDKSGLLTYISNALSLSAKEENLKKSGKWKDIEDAMEDKQMGCYGGIFGSFVFPLSALEAATNKFSEDNIIGQGGFGQVFRGELPTGQEIAVKRLGNSSQQGEREFLVEVELLSRLHHRNLVNLLGYCDEDDQLMLVYEFVPNGTLRDHLLDEELVEKVTWEKRVKIALSSARGLEYLHRGAFPPVIHRDIKSSNILLEVDYEAKVADFGLSKLGKFEESLGGFKTHITTRVKGTLGYLDPSYYEKKQLTEKSDVYSFGVVLLELLTGRLPVWTSYEDGGSLINLVEWTEPFLKKMDLGPILAHQLDDRFSDSITNFGALALRCVNVKGKLRPTMTEVVRELEIVERLAEGWEKKMPSQNVAISNVHESKSVAVSPQLPVSPEISVDMGNSWVSFQVEGSEASKTSKEFAINPLSLGDMDRKPAINLSGDLSRDNSIASPHEMFVRERLLVQSSIGSSLNSTSTA